MADTELSDLAALTGASLATGDLAHVLDVSDTTMSAEGTDKKITAGELKIGLATTLGMVSIDKIFDAKGDLAVGTAADTAAKLTAGANGTAIFADSSQSTGLLYAYTSPSQKPTSTYQTSSSRGSGDLAQTLNRLLYVPMVVAVGHAYTKFGCRVSAAAAAGGTIRVGIYAPAAGGVPGALITDGGTVASDSTGNKFASISYTPVTPIVWVACVAQGNITSLTLSSPNNASGWDPTANFESGVQKTGALYEGSISGALPSTAGTLSWDNWGVNYTAIAY